MPRIKIENAGGSDSALYSVAIALISQAQYEMAVTMGSLQMKRLVIDKTLVETPSYTQKEASEAFKKKGIPLFDVRKRVKHLVIDKILAEVPYVHKEAFKKNIQLFDVRKQDKDFLKSFNLILQEILTKENQESKMQISSPTTVTSFPRLNSSSTSSLSNRGAQFLRDVEALAKGNEKDIDGSENNIMTLVNYFNLCLKLNNKEKGYTKTNGKVEIHINQVNKKEWHTLIEVFPCSPNLEIPEEINKLTKYARGISLSLDEISEVVMGYIKDGFSFMNKKSRKHVSVAERIIQEIKKDRGIDSIMSFIAEETSKLNLKPTGDFAKSLDYLFYRYNGKSRENYFPKNEKESDNNLIESVTKPLL